MTNQPSKSEIPVFSRYGNMKGVTKCRKWGWFGVIRGYPRSLRIAPFDRAHYKFLLAFRRKYVFVELLLVTHRQTDTR